MDNLWIIYGSVDESVDGSMDGSRVDGSVVDG